jgi:hypothetical protein
MPLAATKVDQWGVGGGFGLSGADIDDLKMIAGIFNEIADHRESREQIRELLPGPEVGYRHLLCIFEQNELDIIDLLFIDPDAEDLLPKVRSLEHGFKGNQEHLAHSEVKECDPGAFLSERFRKLVIETMKGGILE